MGGVVSTPSSTTTAVTSTTAKTSTSTSSARTTSTTSSVKTTSSTTKSSSSTSFSTSTKLTSTSTPVTSSSVLSSSVTSTSKASTSTSLTTSVASSTSSSAVISSTPSSTSSAIVSSSSSSATVSSSSSSAAVSSTSSAAISSTSSSVVSSSTTASVVVTVSTSSTAASSTSAAPSAIASGSISNTILLFARDLGSSYSLTSGLNGYGIPYELVIVPQAGVTLPTLSANNITGNYGGIVVLSEVAYNYNGSWASALSTDQWTQIYNYQSLFGVRLVRLDVFPTADFGATTAIAGAGCCNTGVSQPVYFTNTDSFSTAGLNLNAGVPTSGLWHYPATITNPNTTVEIAAFGPSSDGTFKDKSTAAVINTFTGPNRQQMVWFTGWATEWSQTSTYLQHSYIHWLTHGLFVGRRRIYFSTQIDDVHLITGMYYPNTSQFRLTTGDLDAHVTWQKSVNDRLPAGSKYIVELGHNGNGDIEQAVTTTAGSTACVPNEAIEYPEQIDTALEFQKVLGTGSNIWPATPANYTWSLTCAKLDALANWFTNPTNLNSYAHISHTYSHMSLNNATYSDAYKEIQFNQKWLAQVGISGATLFSKGLIPPAITGLHNGDVIRAWLELGINNVMGDNTRPVLANKQSEFYALTSTVADNGYAGLEIMPRWATTIFYNCDTPDCTVLEWINTSAGKGNITDLLNNAREVNTWHLFALRHDAFMFHQANMRQTDMPVFTVGNQSGKMSLLMMWTETIIQEMGRLTSWPLVTLKQDDLAQQFTNRQTLDGCKPNLSYQVSSGKITGVTVTANGNTCAVPIPVTFPGTASTSASGSTSEKLGADPLTVWTTLSGQPVTYTLGSPVTLYP